jgi:hypothetical protein
MIFTLITPSVLLGIVIVVALSYFYWYLNTVLTKTLSEMENFNETTAGGGAIEFTPNSVGYLGEMRRWTLFLSVIGFIFIGLVVVMSLFTGGMMRAILPMGGLLVTILMLILALIYFFPIYFLFKFSAVSKEAIGTNDSLKLEEATRYLKRFFKYIGIMTIVLLCIYVIGIIVGGLGAAMMAGQGFESFQ